VFILNNVVFNPEGSSSQWQHFQVGGEYQNAGGAGAPTSNRADNDLRIAGNVVWNGPAGFALGLGDDGCPSSHPTCSDSYVRANNRINTREPAFADLSNRDVRPTGALLNERSVSVPDFEWSDLPSRPQATAGERSNRIAFDRNGRARGASDPPGAAIPQ
jgi:hypothetical protein